MANLFNNRVNATATDAQVTAVKGAIQTILNNLPFLVSLTVDERKSLSAIDVANKEFTLDAIAAMSNNPTLVPPYVSLTNMQADMKLFNQLDEISLLINQLSERIEDTKMLAGSEAYQSALSMYGAFGNAADAGVSGTDTIVSQLKKRFTNAKSPTVAVPVPDPPAQ